MHGTKFAWLNTQTGMKKAVSKIKGWISDYMLSFFPSNFLCYFAFSCSENMGNKIRKETEKEKAFDG